MQSNQKIPEGWSVISLKNCVKIFGRIGYRGYTCEDIVKKGEGTITLSPSNIIDNKINYENNTYISWYKYEESPEIKIKSGDIIFVKTGSSFGKSAIIRHLPEPATINPQLIIFKDFKGNKEYFAYLISSFNFQKKVHQTVVGGTIPTLSQEEIYKYTILLPPLAEQEKIAGILGTWDEAIEKLSNLIEQKKLLKKGLMQKLLTGKTRLSTFTQPWKEVKLGEICTMFSGGTPLVSINEYYENGNIPFIRSGEISSIKTELYITELGLKESSAKMVNIGDLLYALYGATSGETAISKIHGAINQAILCIKSSKIVIKYLYYILLNRKNIILAKYLQGGQGNLSADIIKKLHIIIPSDISEQQAIADVLSTADDEINLLNQKLEALKEQKKGLMQQLLTGQIRVKVN